MRRLYRPLLVAASSSRRHVVSMASAASTAGIIASGVAAPLAALYVGQRSVIYPRPPVYDDAKTYGGEFAEIVRADGVVGLFVPPPKADEQIIALYFHGNADQITWGGAMIGQALRSRGLGTANDEESARKTCGAAPRTGTWHKAQADTPRPGKPPNRACTQGGSGQRKLQSPLPPSTRPEKPRNS